MKKTLCIFALTLCSLLSFTQFTEDQYDVVGNQNIYGSLWIDNTLELGTFWVRWNEDSAWLEKPYGTWIAPFSRTSLLYEWKIPKAAGYAKWNAVSEEWEFADETYALETHDHSGVYEPTISKIEGYSTWDGDEWIWKDETYSLSTHDHDASYAPIETYESVSRTIYIATTGNDVTGDGTVGNPFANLLRAYQDIKDVINVSVVITIDIAAGTYAVDLVAIENEYRKKTFLNLSTLIVNGKLETLVSGITLVAHSPEAYIYDVTGATFTTNEHQDRFIYNGTDYYPIASNTSTTINSMPGIAGASRTIVQSTVNFTLTGQFVYISRSATNGSQTFEFNNINFTHATAVHFRVNNVIDYQRCKFNCASVNNDASGIRLNFKSCAFVISTGGFTQATAKIQYKNVLIRKSGSKANVGLMFNQNYTLTSIASNGLYISNFATGIVYQQGSYIAQLLGGATLVIDGCTTGFEIRNSTFAQFTSAVPVYITGVTTLLSNNETLNANYSFCISTLVGTPTTYVSTAVRANGYVNFSKNVCILIPGLYPELENNLSATLTDNTNTDIVIGLTTQNTAIWVEYRIARSTGSRLGRIQLMYDGTSLYLSPDEFITNGVAGVNETAIVFSPYLDGTSLKLRATLNNTGSNATMSYNVERIMN